MTSESGPLRGLDRVLGVGALVVAASLVAALTHAGSADDHPTTRAGLGDCAALVAHLRPAAEAVVGRAAKAAARADDSIVGSLVASAVPPARGGHLDLPIADGQAGTSLVPAVADGTRLLLVGSAGGGRGLRVVDTAGGKLRELGFLRLDTAQGLLLLPGRRALVVGQGPSPDGTATETTLATVDLADPAHPVLLRSEAVSGSALTANVDDGVVRVVLASPSRLPQLSVGGRTAAEALAAVPAEAWLPELRTVDPAGESVVAPLLDCAQVHVPDAPAGVGVTSVLTMDADDPAGLWTAAGVAGLARVAHVGENRVYLGAVPDADPSTERSRGVTDVHAFDATKRRTAAYVASGRVPGLVPGAGALSESAGVLRVVFGANEGATMEPGAAGRRGAVAFAEEGAELRQVGLFTDAGGDLVHSVRWLGDLAVAAERLESPRLAVFDLADPAHPRLAATPTLPGHIGFLHPVGGRRLLGVGPVPDQGGLPVQLSALDFGPAGTPTRAGVATIGGDQSPAPYTAGSFGWLPDRRIAVVPASGDRSVPDRPGCEWRNGRPSCSEGFGVVGFVRLADDGSLRTLGTFDPGGYVRLVVGVGRNVVVLADFAPMSLVDPETGKVLDQGKVNRSKGL